MLAQVITMPQSQPFAWAVRMMHNATVHTKGCLAIYYFCYYLCCATYYCAVHCCHFCLCYTLLVPLFAYAVCYNQYLYLMYIASAIATRDATIYQYITYRIVSRLYHNIFTKLNCIDISLYRG